MSNKFIITQLVTLTASPVEISTAAAATLTYLGNSNDLLMNKTLFRASDLVVSRGE